MLSSVSRINGSRPSLCGRVSLPHGSAPKATREQQRMPLKKADNHAHACFTRYPIARYISVVRCTPDGCRCFATTCAFTNVGCVFVMDFFAFRDDLGIIKRVGELAADNGVSIHAILQNPIEDPSHVDFVVTTDPCK